jgi:hypothetical protein
MGKELQTPLKELSPEERKRDAKGWLCRSCAANIVAAYSRRYGVRLDEAYLELLQLGQGSRAAIACYEVPGIEWEYRFAGGEETICPKEHEDPVDDDELFAN